jgi:hypothetical protein
MTFNPFALIRHFAKAAVHAGVADAVAEYDPGDLHPAVADKLKALAVSAGEPDDDDSADEPDTNGTPAARPAARRRRHV